MGKKITIKKTQGGEETPSAEAKAATKTEPKPKVKKKTTSADEHQTTLPISAPPSTPPSVAGPSPPESAFGADLVKKTKRSKPVDEDANAPRDEQGRVIKEVITVGEESDEDEGITEDEDHSEEELAKIKKWWLEEPFRSLLDPELVKKADFLKYDLSNLINEFVEKMLKEELIDFRISGLAINSSAKLYHWKITDVIKEEEKIEEAKARERIQREIPKAIAQPLRESRKLASADELFSAMRRAIIETMQNREKLRIRRERAEAKKTTVISVKTKGHLPAEILKHITGSDETIEQKLNRWHQKIKEIIRLDSRPNEDCSLTEIRKLIWSTDKDEYGKRLEYIQLFEALMFLASLNKIRLTQIRQRDPIEIQVIDKTPVDLH